MGALLGLSPAGLSPAAARLWEPQQADAAEGESLKTRQPKKAVGETAAAAAATGGRGQQVWSTWDIAAVDKQQ